MVPRPRRGTVIRYAYLWADEHLRGREEAQKDRPAIALALSARHGERQVRLLVVAITHTPPRSPTDAVAIPAAVKRGIGLDDVPAWVVTTEANIFTWPGPDVRPVPGRLPPTPIYGTVPDALLRRVARSYLANRARQRLRLIPRTK